MKIYVGLKAEDEWEADRPVCAFWREESASEWMHDKTEEAESQPGGPFYSYVALEVQDEAF